MTRQHKIFFAGFGIYLASFFLFAVAASWPRSAPLRGYECAVWAFSVPLHSSDWVRVQTWDIFVFLSAWTNVVFLGFLALNLLSRFRRLLPAMRIIVLSTIPFSWLAFYYGPFYPREGYFFWLLGMLLLLFSDMSGTRLKAAA